MQLERREMAGIAGQDGPSSLHQIDHMDAAVAADGHFAFRADAEGIQKFSLVEPGAFHSAVFVPVDYRDFVRPDFLSPTPCCGTIEYWRHHALYEWAWACRPDPGVPSPRA